MEESVVVVPLEFLEGAVGLFEGVSSEGVDVLLQQIHVLVDSPLALGPLDLKTEDARVSRQDEALQLLQVHWSARWDLLA